MKTTKQRKGEPKGSDSSQKVAVQNEAIDASRRQFSKAGLALSGVLLTLASRPSLGGGGGFGGGGVCKSPSGFLSGNLSHHGTPQTCSGRTPGYWKTHPESWPSPYLPGKCTSKKGKSCTGVSEWSGGTLFRNVFNCSGNGSIYYNYSMMQVICLGGSGDPYQLGAHIVSALLNARMGWTPVLTETQVKNMFNEWAQKGYFEPTAGVKWYPEDIVNYLKSTMPL